MEHGGENRMDYISEIRKLFPSASFKVEERMKVVEIKSNCTASCLPNYENIVGFIGSLPGRDSISISIQSEGELIFILSTSDVKNLAQYDYFREELYPEDNVSVILSINKDVAEETFSIYSFDSFCSDLQSLSISKFLSAFTYLLSGHNHLYFDVFDKQNVFFKTGTMLFSSTKAQVEWGIENRLSRLSRCRESSCFYNQAMFPLIPEDFFCEADSSCTELKDLFLKIATIFSYVYISSNSSIEDEMLHLQITGHRSVEYSCKLSDISTNRTIVNLYKWIYTDGNSTDKALLARNSISLQCRYITVAQIDERLLSSIQANYDVYLRDNVEKYIGLTNSMAEYIERLYLKTNECLSDLFGQFKANLFAGISFIFTVVLANIVGGQPLDNIFTNDVTVICYLFLLGSLFFLAVSVFEIIGKRKRLEDQFNELVKHYDKVLSREEIDYLTENGKTLLEVKRSLIHKTVAWSVIWGCLIIAFFIVVDVTGDGPHLLNQLFS